MSKRLNSQPRNGPVTKMHRSSNDKHYRMDESGDSLYGTGMNVQKKVLHSEKTVKGPLTSTLEKVVLTTNTEPTVGFELETKLQVIHQPLCLCCSNPNRTVTFDMFDNDATPPYVDGHPLPHWTVTTKSTSTKCAPLHSATSFLDSLRDILGD